MKAAVLRDFKTPLTVQHVSPPKPTETEVLIKVEVCGVCHSDLHVADGDWSQFAGIVKRPLILGHEVVGVIVEVGSAVQDVKVGDREILKGINLTVNAGEVHSIMGPNGSGKSTLAQVLARRETYNITGGEVLFNGKDLLAMKPEEAACEGLFLAFQYPVEIPGISNAYFLRSALNAVRKYRGLEEMDAMDFLPMLRQKLKLLGMDEKLLNRSVNEAFSGGEKKRNEILQMAVLEPKLAILDETDSGLDIDALRTVAEGVNAMRNPERAILVVTHYQRLLNYIVPDRVHVLVEGRIVRSGGPELALELEDKGYATFENAAGA